MDSPSHTGLFTPLIKVTITTNNCTVLHAREAYTDHRAGPCLQLRARFHTHTLSCVNPQIINARSSRVLTLGGLLCIKVIQIGLLGQRFKVSYRPTREAFL